MFLIWLIVVETNYCMLWILWRHYLELSKYNSTLHITLHNGQHRQIYSRDIYKHLFFKTGQNSGASGPNTVPITCLHEKCFLKSDRQWQVTVKIKIKRKIEDDLKITPYINKLIPHTKLLKLNWRLDGWCDVNSVCCAQEVQVSRVLYCSFKELQQRIQWKSRFD